MVTNADLFPKINGDSGLKGRIERDLWTIFDTLGVTEIEIPSLCDWQMIQPLFSEENQDLFYRLMADDGKMLAVSPDITAQIMVYLSKHPAIAQKKPILGYTGKVIQRPSWDTVLRTQEQTGFEILASREDELEAVFWQILGKSSAKFNLSQSQLIIRIPRLLELWINNSCTDILQRQELLNAWIKWNNAECLDILCKAEINPLWLELFTLALNWNLGNLDKLQSLSNQLVPHGEVYFEELNWALAAAKSQGIDAIPSFIPQKGLSYYTGFYFEMLSPLGDVLARGGRYDDLLRPLGDQIPALGAVFLTQAIGKFISGNQTKEPLTIALPKGRMLESLKLIYPKLDQWLEGFTGHSRELILNIGDMRCLLLKGKDIPLYVARGTADIGIVGQDILWDLPQQLLQIKSLDAGYCRLVIAAPDGVTFDELLQKQPLRLATKFGRVSQQYFAKLGHPVDILPVDSSVEMAPGLGLSDAIVDLVETGTTLKENGLKEVKTIGETRAQIIAHPAKIYRYKNEIQQWIEEFLSQESVCVG